MVCNNCKKVWLGHIKAKLKYSNNDVHGVILKSFTPTLLCACCNDEIELFPFMMEDSIKGMIQKGFKVHLINDEYYIEIPNNHSMQELNSKVPIIERLNKILNNTYYYDKKGQRSYQSLVTLEELPIDDSKSKDTLSMIKIHFKEPSNEKYAVTHYFEEIFKQF